MTGSSGLDKDGSRAHAARSRGPCRGRQEGEGKRSRSSNNADNLAYQCEKQLKDLGEKIPADKKTEIEGKINDVREALKGRRHRRDQDRLRRRCRTSSRA
ncbi:MAG: hypothetical protein QM796_19960 [Chthoniobacteraceae bacterium]